jgi:hypothetical protein
MKSLKLRYIALLGATLGMPLSGVCSSEVTAHVVTVGPYGNGNVYVALDQTVDEPTCSSPYLEFPANAPAAKAVIATAELAAATNATIRVKTDTCYLGSPSFSGQRGAWFVITKQ